MSIMSKYDMFITVILIIQQLMIFKLWYYRRSGNEQSRRSR